MPPGIEHADRTDFIGAAGIGLAEIARDVERLVEILAVDDIEAEQLFLGLGIGAVEHDRRIVLAQRGRRGRRQQPRHRAEPALLGQFVLHHGELLHDRGVLFPGPGTDEVFIVVAKDGVEHAVSVPVWCKDGSSMPGADSNAEIFCRRQACATASKVSPNFLHGMKAKIR